ncbi:MAG: ATP-binding protein [Bifidobacterium psychraerophilum]|uniref:ATP-binding protein n=1 Tax=Bifidobacterium psychraerophilum TaxID=218140 RepID=UPI0039EC4278
MSGKKEYPIEIDPSILELLGPSLYTNIYYVLAELIANAYDADANNVWIDVNASSISVEDDGIGMSYSRHEVNRYLSVATQTRTSEEDSTTPLLKRQRMGRKGIGKLAALAVSAQVYVMTIGHGEKSGFILARTVPDNHNLTPIPDKDINLLHASDSGTRILMENPEYACPKTAATMKRNLVKFFPQISDEFRIHIHIVKANGTIDETVISSFGTEIVSRLDTLTVYGEGFGDLISEYERLTEESDGLMLPIKKHDAEVQLVSMKNKLNQTVSVKQEVRGWIGTYSSTRGLKLDQDSDFPDNYLAVYSHEKLGKFNLLEEVGRNRLYEVYLVGQLYVDSFEDTMLPDMALSNRQGYKSSDPRYAKLLEWSVALVKDAVDDKATIQKIKSREKDNKHLDKKKEQEESLKRSVNKALDALDKILPNGINEQQENISEVLTDVGTKTFTTKENERKVLISQTEEDALINNYVYNALLHNGFSPEEIIYSNSTEHVESAIPYDMDLYEYLRTFFVQSFADKQLFVIYIDTENSVSSHGVTVEVGAGWVVQASHGIVECRDGEPKRPLDGGKKYTGFKICDQRMYTTKSGFVSFQQMLEHICAMFGKTVRRIEDNRQFFISSYAGQIVETPSDIPLSSQD